MNLKTIGFIDGKGNPIYIGDYGIRDDHSICPNWESKEHHETRYDKIKAYCLETKSIRISINNDEMNVELLFKPNKAQLNTLENIWVRLKTKIFLDVEFKELQKPKEKSVYGGDCYVLNNFKELKEVVAQI